MEQNIFYPNILVFEGWIAKAVYNTVLVDTPLSVGSRVVNIFLSSQLIIFQVQKGRHLDRCSPDEEDCLLVLVIKDIH